MAGLGVGPGGPPGNRGDYGNEQKALLNTYIHNYLVHEGHFDLAKAIRSSNMAVNQQKLRKETGNNNKSLVNGADDDVDSKDDGASRSDGSGNNKPGDTFLLDYWFIFWDMWWASKKSADKQSENAAGQYWDHQKAKKTLPNQQMLPQSMMAANGFAGFSRGGVMPNAQFNLQKAAMVNNGRNIQPQQLRMQQMAQQQQMPMDGSDVDLNGQQRPQSPMSSGENAPSPKRQRVDGAQFNGGPPMSGPGRNQILGQLPNGAGGNLDAIRMQDPKSLSPAQINQLLSQRNNQSIYSQQMANSAKGMINNFSNGMANGMGMNDMPNDGNMDPQMFNGGGRNMGTNGGALADYQMQLMLLEQQNKKRLMVARQENAHDRQQSLIGQNGFGGTAMSPRGSRTGQSPNAQDRQRGTPRMGQGSPLPDGTMPQNNDSPAPPNFTDPNQMSLAQQFVPPNGSMMRPPPGVNPMNAPGNPLNPHQMEMLQRNGGRLPNGNWQNGPLPGQMGPQGVGPLQNQGDGNQQRSNMPPPQAPPATGNAGRSQPSPTPQAAAPPTPSQNNKTTKKKDGKEPKKKNAKKGQSTTGATPNAETERAVTPTPPTPITPVNAESHLIKGQQPNNAAGAQAPPQTSTAPGAMTIPPSQDNGGMSNQPFGNIDTDMFNIGDFPAMDNTDVLDAFDFDSFLDPSGLAGDFPDFQMPGEGVETGTGDA